jgi:NADPH2:quinone reductase
VGSDDKIEKARAYGCDQVINRCCADISAQVRGLTAGVGVQAVYDSIGAATFDASLDCLAPLGTMVSLGNASGPVPPVNILDLAQRGSLTLVRPIVFSYIQQRDALEHGAKALFDMIESGQLTIEIAQRFKLNEAVSLHDLVESRQTIGMSILLP